METIICDNCKKEFKIYKCYLKRKRKNRFCSKLKKQAYDYLQSRNCYAKELRKGNLFKYERIYKKK